MTIDSFNQKTEGDVMLINHTAFITPTAFGTAPKHTCKHCGPGLMGTNYAPAKGSELQSLQIHSTACTEETFHTFL